MDSTLFSLNTNSSCNIFKWFKSNRAKMLAAVRWTRWLNSSKMQSKQYKITGTMMLMNQRQLKLITSLVLAWFRTRWPAWSKLIPIDKAPTDSQLSWAPQPASPRLIRDPSNCSESPLQTHSKKHTWHSSLLSQISSKSMRSCLERTVRTLRFK